AVSSNYNGSQLSCSASTDGEITITASGGTGSLSYSLDGGTYQSSNIFTGVGAGSHTISVKDANGCSTDVSITLTAPPAITAGAAASSNYNGSQLSCSTSTDGEITITASGGTGSLSYSLDNGVYQSSNVFTNVGAGLHTINIKDANGCSTDLSITLIAPQKILISITKSDVQCNGSNEGAVDLTVTGGTGSYIYSWTGINNYRAASQDISNLKVGSYTVSVTDANGCTATETVTITEPAALALSTNVTNVKCNGGSSGTARVLVNGGTAPYTYNWSTLPVQTTSVANNLKSGTYEVTVTDAHGCTAIEKVIISEPAELVAKVEIKATSCSYSADGSVSLMVTGGVEPYTYSWMQDSNNHTSTAGGLQAGTYNILVKDANNCTVFVNAVVNQGNCPPVAGNDKFKSKQNEAIEGSVVENDTDPDGDNLIYSQLTLPENGTLHFNSDGKFKFYPKNDWSGTTFFDYSACDGKGLCNNARVMITVVAVNHPPVAADDVFSAEPGTVFKGCICPNDFDQDKDALSFSKLTEPTHGTLEFTPDGKFTYIASEDFTGEDTYTYQACDPSGECSIAKVTINVANSPVVNLTPERSSVMEGKKTTVTARLSRAFYEDVVVTLNYAGSATKERDYFLLDQYEQLVIPAGQTSTKEKITIAALGDDIDEQDEKVLIDIAGVSNPLVRIGKNAIVTIQDIYPQLPPDENPVQTTPENPELVIDPLVSPNNDGIKDHFDIKNIKDLDNEVIILNRWGNEVFRIKNYNESDRVFKGVANTGLLTNTNTELVDGVYYYLIYTYQSGTKETRLNKGYLILKR
ncbi:Ig-like domain-containing protein, partial [Rubrolithibacter danxiaensis]|uniref:Ig-like domain-containing protein n=1 Tax=Rubrolithibacter danxiaensis TaxID=3390805 RepID=UPI003BF8B2C7